MFSQTRNSWREAFSDDRYEIQRRVFLSPSSFWCLACGVSSSRSMRQCCIQKLCTAHPVEWRHPRGCDSPALFWF